MISSPNKPVFCFKRWTRKGFAIFASLHKVVKIGVVTFTCTLVQNEYQLIFAKADSTTFAPEDVALQEVEVSASQSMRWSELTHSVSVVEQKDIAATPAQSIDDILERIPGIDIRQRGSDGVQSDISLNGGSFDQVLILLNGVNLTDPQTGHHNLNLPVDLNQIQRIEILRGSGARTLGSNAFCGAINIITTKPFENSGHSGQAEIATGSWGFLKTAVSLSFHTTSWHIDGSLSRKESDGFTDNTDYNILNSHIQTSFQCAAAGVFLLQLGYQQKAYGANSFYSFAYPNQFEATKTLFSALSWEKVSNNARLQAQLYERRHHDRFELFRDMKNASGWYTGHNYHVTDVNGGNLSRTVHSKQGKSHYGTDIRHESILSNVLGEALSETRTDFFDENALYTKGKQRTTVSTFFDQTLYLGTISLSSGISGNYNSEYRMYWNGGADAAWQPMAALKTWINVNRSLRLPTFTDLYYTSAIHQSNPHLKPETAITFENGLTYNKNHLRTEVTFWHRWGDNLIDWVKAPDSTKWESQNLTSVNALGVNTYAEYQFEQDFLQFIRVDYTYQHLNKKAEGYDSKYTLDYLKHKVDVKLDVRLFERIHAGRVSALLNTSFNDRSGNYTDFATNGLTNYVPYWLCDTRFLWSRQSLQLYVDVNNLLNTTYADFGGLVQPGISIKIGLKYTY